MLERGPLLERVGFCGDSPPMEERDRLGPVFEIGVSLTLSRSWRGDVRLAPSLS